MFNHEKYELLRRILVISAQWYPFSLNISYNINCSRFQIIPYGFCFCITASHTNPVQKKIHIISNHLTISMNKSLCVRADRLRKWEVRGRVRSVEREEGAELIAEKGENEAILETLSRCSTLTLIYIYIYILITIFFFF